MIYLPQTPECYDYRNVPDGELKHGGQLVDSSQVMEDKMGLFGFRQQQNNKPKLEFVSHSLCCAPGDLLCVWQWIPLGWMGKIKEKAVEICLCVCCKNANPGRTGMVFNSI